MEFTIERDSFLKSLGHANGIVEKKTTLPILSNVLIEAKNAKMKNTIIRQLYYPFRQWQRHTNKKVITLFKINIIFRIFGNIPPPPPPIPHPPSLLLPNSGSYW